MKSGKRLPRLSAKEARMSPKEPKFVGEVPVVNRLKGDQNEGQVIGSAKIEKTPDGHLIAHIDASGMGAEILRQGFSLGNFSIMKDGDETSAGGKPDLDRS